MVLLKFHLNFRMSEFVACHRAPVNDWVNSLRIHLIRFVAKNSLLIQNINKDFCARFL